MYIYQSQQVYKLDQQAINLDQQPSIQLMGKAAYAVWLAIQERWPEIQHMVILAGVGNNGGDAFALANMVKKQGLSISLFVLGDLSRQSEESEFYRKQWLLAGGEIHSWQGECPSCDLIVDGLLGIGINKPLDDHWQSLIRTINQQQAKRVSIDIPSGLNADTGIAMPVAVEADVTVSFIGRKVGCYLADGPDFCGEFLFDDLGISNTALKTENALCEVINDHNVKLPQTRQKNSYKNQFGHVLVVGGDRGMSGAVRLAAMAALRAGAGLVSVCVHPDNYQALTAADPEIMVGVWDDLSKLIKRANVIIVGPGLGQSTQAKQLLEKLTDCTQPMVVDADALSADFLDSLESDRAVITPHPGEAARLLAATSQEIQQDRIFAIQKLTKRWLFSSVLKGSGSLVSEGTNQISLCMNGHPGMATAGSGDVLSGLVGSYLGQGLTPYHAARTGVFVHALAAEHFAFEQNANSLIASDLIQRIGLVTREITMRQK